MTTCPTPDKVAHKSRRAARAHLWSLWRKRGGAQDPTRLHVYQCTCKRWHVGHGGKR